MLSWNQFRLMAQPAQFPPPVMGRGAGLHSHQAGRLPGKPGRQRFALQSAFTVRISTHGIKNILCQIQSNCRNLASWSSPMLVIVGNTSIMAQCDTDLPDWEEIISSATEYIGLPD